MRLLGDRVLGFEYVLTGKVNRVEGRGSTPTQFTLAMSLLDTRTGAQLGSVVENAPSEAELVSRVHNAVLKLVGKVLKGRTGTLVVSVTEAGAAVKVDDTLLGVTPLNGQLSLSAGPHLLSVEKKGFITAQKEVRIAPDKMVEEQVTLTPSPDFIKDYEASASHMRIGAWTASAVAVVGWRRARTSSSTPARSTARPISPAPSPSTAPSCRRGSRARAGPTTGRARADLKAKIQTAQLVSLSRSARRRWAGAWPPTSGSPAMRPTATTATRSRARPQVAVVPTSGGASASATWQF